MKDQAELFPPLIRGFYRTTDPATSRAFNTKTISKELTVIMRAIMELGRDFTARELSKSSGIGYHLIQKRLSVLKKLGLITKSDNDEEKPLKRNGQMVWWKI